MRTKQLSCDLARIKTVIEGDRKNVSADVENMLKYDLTCVLGGYFDLLSQPNVEIYTEKGKVKVRVTLSARSVKNAGVRPYGAGVLK